MRQRRPLAEALREAAPLTGHVPPSQQELTVGALLGLAYHYVDEEVVRAILEELSMANPLQEMIDEREAQGEARGEVRGRREAVRTILRTRFGALPQPVERRIATVDADQLDALIARAATVESPDAL